MERKKLIISLHDNGQGFDMNDLAAGNGLINMRERAKKIKGDLRIESQPGDGTLIEFRGRT